MNDFTIVQQLTHNISLRICEGIRSVFHPSVNQHNSTQIVPSLPHVGLRNSQSKSFGPSSERPAHQSSPFDSVDFIQRHVSVITAVVHVRLAVQSQLWQVSLPHVSVQKECDFRGDFVEIQIGGQISDPAVDESGFKGSVGSEEARNRSRIPHDGPIDRSRRVFCRV